MRPETEERLIFAVLDIKTAKMPKRSRKRVDEAMRVILKALDEAEGLSAPETVTGVFREG